MAEAKAVVAPLALFVDAEGADANGDVKRQTPEPGAATPTGGSGCSRRRSRRLLASPT